jgi:hypothetical protein
MVMILVVILIAAITTVIAASVDLSRMAVYKQNQSEREATWQYCVESGEAFVVEDLVTLADTSQSFSKTVNGVSLTVTAAPDIMWNYSTGVKTTVTGTLNGKSRTTRVYAGKRSTVNMCQFGIFFGDQFLASTTNFNLTGDAYLDGTINTTRLSVTGDLFGPSPTVPTVQTLTGTYFGRQPGQSIVLDNAKYLAQDGSPTSGTLTLNNPTGIGTLFHSELRHHTGTLTIKGTTTGELTLFVNGNVILDKIRDAGTGTNRLVVICTGTVTFYPGVNDAFVITSGSVVSGGISGPRTLNGSLAGSQFPTTTSTFNIVFDNYFVTNSFGGFRYYIPGQW